MHIALVFMKVTFKFGWRTNEEQKNIPSLFVYCIKTRDDLSQHYLHVSTNLNTIVGNAKESRSESDNLNDDPAGKIRERSCIILITTRYNILVKLLLVLIIRSKIISKNGSEDFVFLTIVKER